MPLATTGYMSSSTARSTPPFIAGAEDLSRDLDAAIEPLRSERSEDADYDPDDEFVKVLTSVGGLGPTVAKRLEMQEIRTLRTNWSASSII